MAEIKFLENGQGYIDFDYLLNLTNEAFVSKVEMFVEILSGNNLDEDIAVKVLIKNKPDIKEVVVVLYSYAHLILKFDSYSGEFSYIWLSNSDIEMLSKIGEMKNEKNN